MFTGLSTAQLNKKLEFIKSYVTAANAADGSKFDANANVTHKNIATLEAEINKDINIQINRTLVYQKIQGLYSTELADEYIRQIEDHEIYSHDESSLKPYCVSVSMYPFLKQGLTKLGGESLAPQHIESFCGSFVNLVFAISSQFAGAVATVEFLLYFDYFARKDYGDNYLITHRSEIANHLQHVVYAINQPAAARGYQSVFWNISLYDKSYFDSMFGSFMFPDFTLAKWESLAKLQAYFLQWINKERTKAILTFPVITCAMLSKDGETVDKEFSELCAKELSEGNSFFIYMSESADSLASCCRLRNEIEDNTFSYTLGAGGTMTGSIKVMTINMNRLVQKGYNLGEQIDKIHKYQIAYRKVVEDYLNAGMLPVYDAGFITLQKQYLTIGINGLVEAAEFEGVHPSNNQEYKDYVTSILRVIYDKNKQIKKETGYMFNTEFVPAENLGVKNSQWDRKDGLFVPRDCYNSYFYVVEDEDTNHIDKFVLHGKELTQYLDGGLALHLNLEQTMSKDAYLKLFNVSAKTGCNYFCINVKLTCCNDCQHIDKKTLAYCPVCESENIDYATRVIGYLKRVSAYSTGRQKEHNRRYYHRKHEKAAP